MSDNKPSTSSKSGNHPPSISRNTKISPELEKRIYDHFFNMSPEEFKRIGRLSGHKGDFNVAWLGRDQNRLSTWLYDADIPRANLHSDGRTTFDVVYQGFEGAEDQVEEDVELDRIHLPQETLENDKWKVLVQKKKAKKPVKKAKVSGKSAGKAGKVVKAKNQK